MNCPRCGKQVPPGSTFCMHCGQMFAQMAPNAGQAPMAGQPFPVAAPTTRKPLWVGAAIGAAALAVVVGGLAISGFLQFRQGTEPALPAVVKNTPPPPDVKMPADIYNWLEHLRKTEARREEMSLEQMGRVQALSAQMLGAQIDSLLEDGPAPTQVASEEIETLRKNWQDLQTYFRSYPPPEECRTIADAYDEALGETGAMMGDLMLFLGQGLGSAEAGRELAGEVNKMKGKSNTIDQAGRLTNQRVQDICDKYNTAKWFEIKSDFGGGNIFSMPMPGLGG